MREAILRVDRRGLILNHRKKVLSCVYRCYHLPFRAHRNTWKTTIVPQCLVNSSKYTSRGNSSIRETCSIFFNRSSRITICKNHIQNACRNIPHEKTKKAFLHAPDKSLTARMKVQSETMLIKECVTLNWRVGRRVGGRVRGVDYDVTYQVQCMEHARRPHFSMTIISETVQLSI